MKDRYFLLAPFAITAFNLLVAIVLQAHHSQPQPILGEIPVSATAQQTSSLESFLVDPGTGEALKDVGQHQEKLVPFEEDDEEDPMMKAMPGTDFKAYVRADIATFYGKEPGTVEEQSPLFNGQAGKFINMSPDPVSLWWDGPNGPVFNSEVKPFGSGGTACYPTHKFIFTLPKKPDKVLCRFNVVEGTSVYYYDPFVSPPEETDPARGVILQTGGHVQPRSLTELSKKDKISYDAHVYNLEFGAKYKNFTGGSEWLAMYPPDPPQHKIWRADRFGQEHMVQTHETQFHHIPPIKNTRRLTTAEMRQGFNNTVHPFNDYRNPGPMNITIKALSCAPRVFEVRNFLSDVEVEHMLGLVAQKNLIRSLTGTTGGQVSDTRTSTTTWLPRDSDPILNVIFRRVADVLRMDEALFRQREKGEVSADLIDHDRKINEDLQVVHYGPGQQYTAHHDFSYQEGAQGPFHVRSINFCMYLNDVPQGGETSFPRWRNAETGKSIDVKPEKGKAAIFYMKNPDGNLDDLTQHAALPVIEGEKFFVNLWISWPTP